MTKRTAIVIGPGIGGIVQPKDGRLRAFHAWPRGHCGQDRSWSQKRRWCSLSPPSARVRQHRAYRAAKGMKVEPVQPFAVLQSKHAVEQQRFAGRPSCVSHEDHQLWIRGLRTMAVRRESQRPARRAVVSGARSRRSLALTKSNSAAVDLQFVVPVGMPCMLARARPVVRQCA